MKDDNNTPQRKNNVSRGSSPISGGGASKPGEGGPHKPSSGDSSNKFNNNQSNPSSSSRSEPQTPQTPPTSPNTSRVRGVNEIEANRQQAGRTRYIDEGENQKSSYNAHKLVQNMGPTGVTGNISDAQRSYDEMMKGGGRMRGTSGMASGQTNPPTITRNPNGTQFVVTSQNSGTLAKVSGSETSINSPKAKKLELTARASYEIVGGGKRGTESLVVVGGKEAEKAMNAANQITGRLIASSRQQIHTSRGYDPSDLTRVTTFYGGKRSMTRDNTDNTSRNADRFMTESIVTNSQGQTTTDKALAKKYGLTYVDPSMRTEVFSGYVPKDANSRLAQEQRTWMIQSLEREKNRLSQMTPRTDVDKQSIAMQISELDTQISNIKDGKFDNSLQPMDRYTHRHSFTFQVKDDSGSELALRRNFAGRVTQKVGLQRYKLLGASNGIARMSARMALDTAKNQNNMASRGLATVVDGAEQAAFPVMFMVNRTLKKYHEDMLNMHLGGLLARDMGGTGGLQVDRVQDIKAHLEQIGLHTNNVKDIMDGQDLQLFARITLRNAQNGKIPPLTEQQTNYLKTIVAGKQVSISGRLGQLDKALESKGFNMGALKGLSPANQAKVLKQEYDRINNILKKAGKPPLDPSVVSMIKERYEIGKHVAAARNAKMGSRYKMRALRQFIIKPLQKNGGIAGEGLATTIQVATLTKSILTFGITKVQGAMRLAEKGVVKAALAATNFKIDRLQAKIEKLRSSGKLRKASDLEEKLGKALTRQNKLNNYRNPLAKLKDKAMGKLRETKLGKGVTNVKNTIKRPFQAISDAWKNAWKNVWNKTIGRFLPKGPNPVVKAIMQVFDKIGKAIGTVVKPILAFCSGFFFAIILITIIVLTISSIINAFNFGGQEYDTQQLIVQYLQNECYLKTFEEIDAEVNSHTPIGTTINSRSITFIDIKDYGDYTKPADDPDNKNTYAQWIAEADENEEFSQSSNCAEILSMALIKFNFNFGTAKDRLILPGTNYDDRYKSVEEYVKKLWNGSHSIQVTSASNENTPDKSVDVSIVWTTIYFNGLFDCELSDSMDIQYYDQLPRTYTFGNLYYFLRTGGLSHDGAIAMITAIESITSSTSIPSLDSPVMTSYQMAGKYGMCAWADPKKTQLLDFLETEGKKSEDLQGQVTFLLKELQTDYPTLYATLVDSTANTLETKVESVMVDYLGKTPSSTPSTTASSTPTTSGFASEVAFANTLSALFDEYKDNAEKLEELKPSDNSLIAETAMKYIGHNHYTQGGFGFPGHRLVNINNASKLATTGTGYKDSYGLVGTDCTGLVMYVMSELGYEHLYWSTSGYPMNVGDKAGSTECIWAGSPSTWSQAEDIIEPGDIIVATGGGMGHAMICTRGKESGTVMQCAMNSPKCGQVAGHCANDSSEKSASGYFSWVNSNYSGVRVRLFRLMA